MSRPKGSNQYDLQKRLRSWLMFKTDQVERIAKEIGVTRNGLLSKPLGRTKLLHQIAKTQNDTLYDQQ